MAEIDPKDRLFNHKKGLQPILNFLTATEIGLRPGADNLETTRAREADRWDIGLLED